jgi:hypothetical protein
MRGVFSRYIGPGAERARKAPIALVIDVLFRFFHYLFLVFSTQIHNFESSLSLSRGPKAILFCFAKFVMNALGAV